MFVLGYVVLSISWYAVNKAANGGSSGWNSGFECFEFTPVGPADCNWVNWNPLSRLVVILLILAGLAASAWGWWFLAVRLLRPLRATAEAVRRVGPQNLGQRIAIASAADELRELADALDGALDRIAAGYESQRRFASNASHELRTPLAVQRLLTEVAMDDPAASQDLVRLGGLLLRTNERNERLIEGLLVLAESDRGLPGKVRVRLDELVASVLDSHLDMAARHEVVLRRDLAQRYVPGDPVLLERLVSNLISNAIAYNSPGGWVEVVVAAEPAITVTNTGQRVPAEAVSSLFEPFRRLTDDRTNHGGGSGLGLSIVRSITSAHDGKVEARPGADGGLIVAISLPHS
jgi:signal transduction histidine kinase